MITQKTICFKTKNCLVSNKYISRRKSWELDAKVQMEPSEQWNGKELITPTFLLLQFNEKSEKINILMKNQA